MVTTLLVSQSCTFLVGLLAAAPVSPKPAVPAQPSSRENRRYIPVASSSSNQVPSNPYAPPQVNVSFTQPRPGYGSLSPIAQRDPTPGPPVLPSIGSRGSSRGGAPFINNSMSAENVRRFGAPAATYGAAFENPVSLSLLGGRSSGSAGGGGHFSATQ